MLDAAAEPQTTRDFVAFRVGEQEFCVDIGDVREIRNWSTVTRLPRSNDYVCGVFNLRGAILPVFDVARRLGVSTSVPDENKNVVVVRWRNKLAGLLVDEVRDIITAADGAMQKSADVCSPTVGAFVDALIAFEDRLIGIFALDRLLSESAEQSESAEETAS